MRTLKVAVLSVSVLAVLAGGVLAYKYSGIHWPSPTMEYYINRWLPWTWVWPLKAGANAWTNAGSNFVFVYKGRLAKGVSWTQGTIDNINVITRGALSPTTYPNVLALNHVWYYSESKEIIDSDIIFNTNFTWTTEGDAWGYDVRNIAAHELGHSLQLDDLYQASLSERTMYGYAGLGETKKQTLHWDDKAGIKYIYGAK